MIHNYKVFLLTIFIIGCNQTEKISSVKRPDFEIKVINAILPHLIPKHPPCVVGPIYGESEEDYDKRLKDFYDQIEASGKKIEIVMNLTKLDSNYFGEHKSMSYPIKGQHSLNALHVDRMIDSTTIEKIEGVQFLFLMERRSTFTEFFDCKTLGQLSLSRVCFNKDSTLAAFDFFLDDYSCMGGEYGTMYSELKDGKWLLKE